MTMEKELVRGNKALAQKLGVHFMTVQKWRRKGILNDATVADLGRVIIYDMNKVLDCLHNMQVKRGRRAAV